MINEILYITDIEGYEHLSGILFKIIEENNDTVKVEVFSNDKFTIKGHYQIKGYQIKGLVPPSEMHYIEMYYIPPSHFPKNILVGSIYTFNKIMFYPIIREVEAHRPHCTDRYTNL